MNPAERRLVVPHPIAMPGRAAFGVCTLRAEVQPGHLLIRVTLSRSLDASVRHPLAPAQTTVTSIGEALTVTEQFLRSFGQWQDPPSS